MSEHGILFEVLIDGVSQGFLLALLGVGITLVFGMGEVLNLAQGAFAILGAILTIELATSGMPILLAIGLGIIIVSAFGGLVDRSLLSFVYRTEGEQRILLGIFVTLGLTLFLEGILFQFYSLQFKVPVSLGSRRFLGILITETSVLIILTSTVLLGSLIAFFNHTYLGTMTRTIAQDEVGAIICGVEPRRMRTLIFVLSVAIAAVVGILQAVDTNMGVADSFTLTVNGVIVSIVGGVRNVRGTVLAGLGLGIILTYANFFIGSNTAFIILIAVALVALVLKGRTIQ